MKPETYMFSRLKPILTTLLVLLTATVGHAADFPVAAFGATGDGKTNDGPAVRKAVAAAVAAGAGSRVVFDQKTYRLDWNRTSSYQISLEGAKNIAIEGNGAVLVNHPRNNLISLKNCSGVSVKGFTVDYDPLPFTQGTITVANAAEGWFDFRIQKGYRHPVDEYESLGLKPPGKDWGVVFDPVERHRRWDVTMHFFMKEFVRSPAGADIARVFFVDETKKDLAKVRPGDRYVITFKYGNSGANNELSGCDNCRFEDFTFHMAKYGMTFAVVNSSARNAFRRVKIAFKPGSDRLIVTPKDGFHCKANRVGPLIEDCFFEGLLDDSINISVCPYWIKKIMTNEIGSFYEGPVPQNCIIRDNVFRNTQGTPVVAGSQRASGPAAYAKNIRITGNRIESISAPCIRAFYVSGLEISGNKFSLHSAASADALPLSLTNTVNETISENSIK